MCALYMDIQQEEDGGGEDAGTEDQEGEANASRDSEGQWSGHSGEVEHRSRRV